MKINDFIFRFPTGLLTRHDGLCRVRTFIGTNSKVYVLLTNLDENTSASITNSIESLFDSLLKRGIVTGECTFIEHYETSLFHGNTFDLVIFDETGGPHWSSIKQSDVEKVLGCDDAELNIPTYEHKRLLNEIARIQNEIDPFINSSWPESPEVMKRRFDIESRMIGKGAISELVENGVNEQELQRLLKSDLTIFAEIYADSKDEYICFSEFPVADGVVDFAVFSGRSRMDVTLIEVKGADFFLVNQGHYDKFASKLEEAVDQIRTRLRHIYENIGEFRSGVHKIRQSVERGAVEHNSLLGPYGKLQVDPNKDINIRCVVIGGRTRNDHEESKKRHDFEHSFSPPIKIESWDTWLRKMRRG